MRRLATLRSSANDTESSPLTLRSPYQIESEVLTVNFNLQKQSTLRDLSGVDTANVFTEVLA
jgi:hypothetical protein